MCLDGWRLAAGSDDARFDRLMTRVKWRELVVSCLDVRVVGVLPGHIARIVYRAAESQNRSTRSVRAKGHSLQPRIDCIRRSLTRFRPLRLVDWCPQALGRPLPPSAPTSTWRGSPPGRSHAAEQLRLLRLELLFRYGSSIQQLLELRNLLCRILTLHLHGCGDRNACGRRDHAAPRGSSVLGFANQLDNRF